MGLMKVRRAALVVALVAASMLASTQPAAAAGYSFTGAAVLVGANPGTGLQVGFGSGVGTFQAEMYTTGTRHCSYGSLTLRFTIADANGNSVTGYLNQMSCPTTLGLIVVPFEFQASIYGGTGLYAGAQGAATMTYSGTLAQIFTFQMSFTTP